MKEGGGMGGRKKRREDITKKGRKIGNKEGRKGKKE